MERGANTPSGVHFHIRWRPPNKLDLWHRPETLDWEIFSTAKEAETRANELVRPGETFAIEQFDQTCPKCAKLKEIASKSAAGRS